MPGHLSACRLPGLSAWRLVSQYLAELARQCRPWRAVHPQAVAWLPQARRDCGVELW